MKMDYFPILLVLALIGAGFGLSIYLDRRRAEAVKAVAETLGFTYSQHHHQYLNHVISHFDVGTKGRNRRIKNLIQGRFEDVEVSIGDYYYTKGSGKNKRTYSQTIAVIDAQQSSFPKFVLAPENFLHKLGGVFGYQDIDFDTHPEFSDRYWLAGPNEEAIREHFTADVLNFFQDYGQKQLCVEGLDSRLMYYQAGQSVKPSDWHKLLNIAYRVYQQF